MSLHPTRLMTVLVALVLVASACGSDGAEAGGGGGAPTFGTPVEVTADVEMVQFSDADGSVWSVTVGTPRDVGDAVLADGGSPAGIPDGSVYAGFDLEMTLLESSAPTINLGPTISFVFVGGDSGESTAWSITALSFGCGDYPAGFDSIVDVAVGDTISGVVCAPMTDADLASPDTEVILRWTAGTDVVFSAG